MQRALTALALVAAQATDREATFDGVHKVGYVELKSSGEATLKLLDGKHRVVATLRVTELPNGSQEESVVGPTRFDSDQSYRIITNVDISVDDCLVRQPVPAIRGMSMPESAVLSAQKGGWNLEIYGGDNAEVYGITYTFDKHRILTRELGWGPGYSERTRYDIQVVPEIFPQQCT